MGLLGSKWSYIFESSLFAEKNQQHTAQDIQRIGSIKIGYVQAFPKVI
jgi:hypothetical protein